MITVSETDSGAYVAACADCEARSLSDDAIDAVSSAWRRCTCNQGQPAILTALRDLMYPAERCTYRPTSLPWANVLHAEVASFHRTFAFSTRSGESVYQQLFELPPSSFCAAMAAVNATERCQACADAGVAFDRHCAECAGRGRVPAVFKAAPSPDTMIKRLPDD